MSSTRQPRPVPEAGIVRWSLVKYPGTSLCARWYGYNEKDYPVFAIDATMDMHTAGDGLDVKVPYGDIIRRAFGPADHECPDASCDVPWCERCCPRPRCPSWPPCYAMTQPDYDWSGFLVGDECPTCQETLVAPALVEPESATREIEARDLRAGMFWRCNCHFHEIVSSTDDGSLIRLTLTPVAGCTWSLAATHTHNEKAVIRADHETQRDNGKPEVAGRVVKSPRELCCTCRATQNARAHGGLAAQNAAPKIANMAPEHHDEGCPVAPIPGVHGGMRLWPAPYSRGRLTEQPWTWDGETGTGEYRHPYLPAVDADELRYIAQYGGTTGIGDAILRCFFLEFTPAPEPDRRVIPVDIDIELEMVAARLGR